MRCAGVSARRRCELQVGQMSIKRRIDNQFLMRAGGRYLTVVDQQNAIFSGIQVNSIDVNDERLVDLRGFKLCVMR